MQFTKFIRLSLVFCVFASHSVFAKAKDSPRSSVWAYKMRQLKETVEALWMESVDEAKFLDPKNESRIRGLLTRFSDSAHELNMRDAIKYSSDPTFAIIAGLLDDDSKAQLHAFNKGDRKFARVMVKATTRYCSACHTHGRAGSEGLQFSEPKGFERLSLLEQADILVSLRNFDKAQKVLHAQIEKSEEAFELEAASHRSLNLAIYREDEVAASQAVVAALKNPALTPEFRKTLITWQTSLEDKNRFSMNADGARKYLERGQKLNRYPKDVLGEVETLRGAKLLSREIEKSSDASERAKLIANLASAIERLNGMDLWELPDYLYAACVTTAPHTETARACAKDYERVVMEGYMGSSGLDLPKEIAKRIEKLKLLAEKEEAPVTKPAP